MVVREAMRLCPPAWLLLRERMQGVEIGGYTLPKGSIVWISPYLMHRDPRYFDEPETFLPERWAGNLEKQIPRYAYFPFGGGPHVCTGQALATLEANILLATILQRCTLTLFPGQTIKPVAFVVERPEHGIRMRVQAR